MLRSLGILPRLSKGEFKLYKLRFMFFIVMVTLCGLTITCDLYEASQDVLQFGEDLVILIGVKYKKYSFISSRYYMFVKSSLFL